MEIEEIPIERIRPNPRQPRETFKKEKIEELAKNIEEQDLLQPIVVRENGDNYEIISGERRWRAFETLGREKINAFVWDVENDTDRDLKSLSENELRENLNSEEREKMYHQVYTESDMTQKEIADNMGIKQQTVSDILKAYRERKERDTDISVKEKLSSFDLKTTAIIKNQGDKNKVQELIAEGKIGKHDTKKYAQVIRDAGEEESDQVKEAVFEDPDKFTPKKAEKIMELDNENAQEEMVMEIEAENLTEDEVTARVERLKDHKEETGDYPEETKIEEPSKRHVEKVKDWSRPSFLMTGGWEDELSLQDRDKVVKELKETRELIDQALRNLGEEPKEAEAEVIDVEVKDD